MRNIAHISAVAFSCTAAASADFVGYQRELITFGNGHVAMNVYAHFSNAGDRVVNVYGTNIWATNAGGFHQSAANPFWLPGTQNKNTSDDSWVTIDTNPNGNGNASGSITAGDPNFFNFDDLNGATDFSQIQSVGNGAGWYNSQPGTQWGYAAEPGTRVLLAHFVVAFGIDPKADYVNWDVHMTVTLADQAGSVSDVGTGTYLLGWTPEFPAPGALALLGIAGLASGRRRS